MKMLILGLSLMITIFSSSILADSANGKVIFEAKGCVLCHKKDMDTVGPSLRSIAISYSGKESTLVTYLKGQGSSIVDPARAPVMTPQLVKIRTLFEEEFRDLAEYIVAAADRPVY